MCEAMERVMRATRTGQAARSRRAGWFVQAARMMRGTRAARSDASGFTLIEVVIAVAVLVAVLAGVAGVWAMTATSTRVAREQTLAMQLARDKLEQLAALTWAVLSVDGADVLASDVTTNVSRLPATTDGSGTQPSPADSLGVSRATYADYLDARGQWLDMGPSPPAGARFVRRWWVARTGSGASEMLMFQVIVATVSADAMRPAGAWWRNHPAAVWLCGAKVRRRVAS
jgi:prepilin-type N-terminal cleavage/methylation domain-containing protein